jgi:anti-sigma factor RsiW
MNATDNNKTTEPDDVEVLLPWHAAGTLSPSDARRVEAALARDPELARRFALVRQELGETIHLNETLGEPSTRAMEKLFAGIDAEPKRAYAASPALGARIAEFFGSLSPRTLAWSAVAAALAIMLQAAVLTNVMLKDSGAPAGYQTASAPGTPSGDEAFTLIRFAPQATSEEINKFLEANKLSVVSGPMTGGLYKVRVAMTGLPKTDLARIVRKLQEDKAVSFIAATE